MSTRFHTAAHPRPNDAHARDASRAWCRQPIVWLGAVVLAASLAGCVWLIVVAERYTDPPLPVTELQILKMPLTRQPPREIEPQP